MNTQQLKAEQRFQEELNRKGYGWLSSYYLAKALEKRYPQFKENGKKRLLEFLRGEHTKEPQPSKRIVLKRGNSSNVDDPNHNHPTEIAKRLDLVKMQPRESNRNIHRSYSVPVFTEKGKHEIEKLLADENYQLPQPTAIVEQPTQSEWEKEANRTASEMARQQHNPLKLLG